MSTEVSAGRGKMRGVGLRDEIRAPISQEEREKIRATSWDAYDRAYGALKRTGATQRLLGMFDEAGPHMAPLMREVAALDQANVRKVCEMLERGHPSDR